MEDVVVQVKAPGTPLSVRADESRLRQVPIKLIGNAIKFTDEGSITVVLHVVEGALPAIRVVDTGVGIPSGRLATIFDAFEQGDGGTTRRHDGAGLGLAISRSLCELMGVDLVAQSTLGESSTFTIAIPESLVVRESLSKVQDVPPNAGG